jgi:hypothetical protein
LQDLYTPKKLRLQIGLELGSEKEVKKSVKGERLKASGGWKVTNYE